MVSRVAWIPYHAKRMPDAEKAYRELLRTYDKEFTTEGVRESVREARLILSNICVQTNRVPEAEQWLEQVLDEYPEDVGALNDLGYLWADQGQHLQRALAMCRHAVRDEPDNRAFRDILGWALHYRVGQYAEAVVELEKAVDTKDPDGVIWDHMGDARWKANQPDAARDAWRRVVAAYLQDHENEKAVAVEAKLKQP